jgi:hypothetical protein
MLNGVNDQTWWTSYELYGYLYVKQIAELLLLLKLIEPIVFLKGSLLLVGTLATCLWNVAFILNELTIGHQIPFCSWQVRFKTSNLLVAMWKWFSKIMKYENPS